MIDIEELKQLAKKATPCPHPMPFHGCSEITSGYSE